MGDGQVGGAGDLSQKPVHFQPSDFSLADRGEAARLSTLVGDYHEHAANLVGPDIDRYITAGDRIADARRDGEYEGNKKAYLDKDVQDALSAIKADLKSVQADINNLGDHGFKDTTLQGLLDKVQEDWPRCNARMSKLAEGDSSVISGPTDEIEKDLNDVVASLAALKAACEDVGQPSG